MSMVTTSGKSTQARARMKLSSASVSVRGRRREKNEDSVLAEDAAGLFAVADGMGGHVGGGEASALLCALMAGELMETDTTNGLDFAQASVTLDRAVSVAVDGMRDLVKSRPELCNMGTTLVFGWFLGSELYYAHSGDSRLYILRNDQLHRLTKDHSIVESLCESGVITESERSKCPLKHVITRYIGPASRDGRLDINSRPLRPADRLIFLTDGITDKLDDEAMRKAACFANSPRELCQWLRVAAQEAGAGDDLSCVVVECG